MVSLHMGLSRGTQRLHTEKNPMATGLSTHGNANSIRMPLRSIARCAVCISTMHSLRPQGYRQNLTSNMKRPRTRPWVGNQTKTGIETGRDLHGEEDSFRARMGTILGY